MVAKLALLGGPSAVRDGHQLQNWPSITAEDRRAVLATLDRGELAYYGSDGWVKALEDAFCDYHGSRFALAVDSGTQALHSAFFGLGFGPGDEVLVPTYTFVATVTPLVQLGAVPRLCDCDPRTGNILPSEVERKVTSKTRGLVVTHMWGHPCDMDALMALKMRYGLKLVEDCSHAHAARYNDRVVGSFGDAACFSLQAKKIVTGGTGGVLLTDDRECYERAVLLGHFRKRASDCVESAVYKPYAVTGLGLNYRMHPLAAALASSQFRRLDAIVQARAERLGYFTECLKQIPAIQPPVTMAHVTRGAFHGYKPFYAAGDLPGVPKALYVAALGAEGVAVQLPGTTPLHRTAIFTQLTPTLLHYGTARASVQPPLWAAPDDASGGFPNCDAYLGRVLDHTTFTYEPRSLIDQYVDAFAKVAANHAALHRLARQRQQP